MSTKYAYMDKIVLFLSCSIIYLAQGSVTLSVLPLLTALTITCFLIIYEEKTLYRLCLYALYFFLSLYFLDLVYFLPLIIYDLMNERNKLLFLLPLLPFTQFVTRFGIIESILIVIVFVIAVFIRYKSSDIVSFKSRYYRLVDDTKELTLQLDQNNKELLQRQDNDIYIATLNERNRIAREIHDHVGHQLSSAILQLGALMAICKDDNTKNNLIELKKTLNIGMDNIRQSVHNLYDTSIDLNEKLKEIIQGFTFCQVNYDNSIHLVPTQQQCYAILAIVKESFSNIIKHSNATEVKVILKEHPSMYQVIIHDNGTIPQINLDHGIGLKNMEQRVTLLHGHFQLRTTQGFEIFLSLPKEF